MARIVVIDDSASILAWMRDSLEAAGHQVITANCGRQGLELAEQHKPHVVITDIYMPESDGIEVIQSVRRMQPSPIVIAMSSQTGKRSMLSVAKSLGAAFCLKKPFSANTLHAAIATASAQHVLDEKAQCPSPASW